MARHVTPPALLAVRQAVRAALDDGRVVVGCSGGADSLALAGALALEAPGRAGLVSIDHGLAPGSAERAAEVAALGATLGLEPSVAVTVVVDGAGGPEAAARDARLAALEAAAGEASIWLAHTRDDQAEQVLLGLARGSGARSLAGMRPTRGRFRRPLLDLPRAVVREACADLGLSPWEDPHNTDARFARARVRHRVLPVVERELGPGVAAALARSARLLAEDADALEEWAAGVAARAADGAIAVADLAGVPVAVRKRALKHLAEAAGAHGVTAAHLDALEALVSAWRGQGAVALPGAVAGFRQTGRIAFDVLP